MTPNDTAAKLPARRRVRVTPELEAELRQADEDFARGDYIELTAEQLDRCIATGESPWPDESPSGSCTASTKITSSS